jgi:uncharacterized protein YbaP (TraB family)
MLRAWLLSATLLIAACATPPVAAREPAVWAVRDADSTIYLYGSIHLRKPGARWGGPTAERALAEASEVWTEVEIDPVREREVQGLVGQYGMDPTRPLSSRLSPQRVQQLGKVARGLGMAPEGFEPMRPWLASVTLAVLPMLKAGYDPEAGVDRTVDRLAEAAGKRMRWFETGEEQIRFLSGFPDDVQIQMLEDALDEAEAGTTLMASMEAAWERGDDRTLARDMVAEMKREYPALHEVILTRRNAAWTDVLAREMAGSGVDMVVVGAAHLVGPDSVVAMLRARGFKVERVSR